MRVNGENISSGSKVNRSNVQIVECLDNPQQAEFATVSDVAEALELYKL